MSRAVDTDDDDDDDVPYSDVERARRVWGGNRISVLPAAINIVTSISVFVRFADNRSKTIRPVNSKGYIYSRRF